MSASDFGYLAELCSMHGAELWCPEIGGPYSPDDDRHQDIVWQRYWDPAPPPWRRQSGRAAPPPVGEPPFLHPDARLNGSVGFLLGGSSGRDAAKPPNSNTLVDMTPREETEAAGGHTSYVASSDSTHSQAPVIWEAVLTNEGWHLQHPTVPSCDDQAVVRASSEDVVPGTELVNAIRLAQAASHGTTIRLIIDDSEPTVG